MHNRRTFSVPYTTVKDWYAFSRILTGTENNAGEQDAGLERTTVCELLPVEQ